MARKQFLVIYSDGSKQHIGAHQKEQMLLNGDIVSIGDNRFRDVRPSQTFHAFSDLSQLAAETAPVNLKRFYPGLFVFELGEKKSRERLESPEAMAARIRNGPTVMQLV